MNDANAEGDDMITEEERDEYLHSDIINFMFGTEREPKWGFSANCNALYKINIQNATAEYVSSVPWERNISGAYWYPIQIKNKLLLSPALARSFAIYDIDSGKWVKIPIPAEATPAKNTHPAFFGVIHCGDYLLICPGVNGVFAKYDIKRGEFSFYLDWFNKFKHNIVDINMGLLWGTCNIDGKLYLTSPQCNVVTELNPDDMSFVLHKVGDKANQYSGITYAKEAFWLIKSSAPGQNDLCAELIEWRPYKGHCVEHTNLPVTRDKSRTGKAFSHILTSDDDIFLFPWHSDHIIKFYTTIKKVEILKPKPEWNYFERRGEYYTWIRGVAMPWVLKEGAELYHWKKVNSRNPIVYTQSPTDYSLIKLDLSTGENTKKKWYVSGAKHLLARIECPGSTPFAPFRDTMLYGLEQFLEALVSRKLPAVDIEKRDYFRSHQANADKPSGENIYKYVKKLVL